MKPPRAFRRIANKPPTLMGKATVRSPRRQQHLSLPATFGVPGVGHQLVLRPGYAPGDPRNELPVQGLPGTYNVVFSFARPGHAPSPERAFEFNPNQVGDSHLAIAAPAINRPETSGREIKVAMTTDFGKDEFIGHANAAGYLDKLVGNVQADTFAAAEVRARAAVTPFVSSLAAQLDVPLWIWRILLTEKATGAQAMSIVSPWVPATLTDARVTSMDPEFRVLCGLYREGLTSSSEVYGYLCFYKIAEAIRHRRAKLAKAVRHAEERVPRTVDAGTAWLQSVYPRERSWDQMALDSVFLPEAMGRRFGDLLDAELNTLRDDIAHVLSKSGELRLSVDDSLHVLKVHHWLPLLRVMVRRMLKNEFPEDFLPHISQPMAG